MKFTPLQKLLTASLVASGPTLARRMTGRSKTWAFNSLSHALLRLMALLFNRRPSLGCGPIVKDKKFQI